ncbi:YeeE/YedE family protein [Ferrimonas senticii]|uniref:YeeE/YedE family protein n=1 Tax=Ferrimonas senticii TaxID=394566 RepID=UPI000428709D|nr:YeeE/YedE family protein [Ferrimonas senticii]
MTQAVIAKKSPSISLTLALSSLLAGLLFGAGMALSQMTDPARVTAFLDVLGQWRGSLMWVMAGALLVFAPGYWLLVAKRQQTLVGQPLQLPTNGRIDRRLLIGAALFGAGWGLAGLCPGPLWASLSSLNPQLLYFLVPMLVGLKLGSWWQR